MHPAGPPGAAGWHDPHFGPRWNAAQGHFRYDVGDRLPANYRAFQVDWRGNQLYAPPPGDYWARVDNDFVLAGLASGAVIAVVPSAAGCPAGYWRGPWGNCRNTPYHGPLPGGGYRP